VQVGQGGRAVDGGAEGDGAGGTDALVPVVGQDERRVLGHGVDVPGGGLLVVVGRADAGRAGGAEQQGRVPQGDVAVEEAGDVLVAEIEGAVGGQAERGQQDQLAPGRGGGRLRGRLFRTGLGRVPFVFWRHHGKGLHDRNGERGA
jgi:hypothetical protein